MSKLKHDAEKIREVLRSLSKQDWIKRSERRWWPQFVFHYTDITNAVKVLSAGCLYSRKHLEDRGELVVSSGSARVLAGTDATIKDCVRLFFRPKTPTQYYAEGIYSKSALARSRFPDAHCPVPIFFLFDAVEILSRIDCYFSDQGLGAYHYQILSSAEELANLPWKEIYQPGWQNPKRANAEIIVPRELDLDALKYIYCRSGAERETLLYLLPSHLRQKYQNRIVSTTRSVLFYRRQTFVENARLKPNNVTLQFSPDTMSVGPFMLRVELTSGERQRFLEAENFSLSGGNYKHSINLPASTYEICVRLDDHLAYANKHVEFDIPF